MDRRGACESIEKGREQGIRPADLDQQRVVQSVSPAPIVDGPLSDHERHDAHATQPGWWSESDLAWLELPREEFVQNPVGTASTTRSWRDGAFTIPLLFKVPSVGHDG